jgi:hypothetical protein
LASFYIKIKNTKVDALLRVYSRTKNKRGRERERERDYLAASGVYLMGSILIAPPRIFFF